MSTIAEIERAIDRLSSEEILKLATWLDERRRTIAGWAVPPPDVPRQELDRVEDEIETAFPTRRR